MDSTATIAAMGGLGTVVLIKGIAQKRLFSPAVLFFTPLLIQYGAYYLFVESGYQLSETTNLLLASASAAFVAGVWLVDFVYKVARDLEPEYPPTAPPDWSPFLIRAFIAIGMLGILWGSLHALATGAAGFGGFFYNIRSAAGEGTHPSAYLILFLHVALLLRLSRRGGRVDGMAVALYLLLTLSAFFTLARTALLTYTASTIACAYVSRRYLAGGPGPIRIRALAIPIALFAGLVWLVAVLTNKDEVVGHFFLLSYIVYPLVSFDIAALPVTDYSSGERVLGIWGKIAIASGLMRSEWVVVPEPDNGFNAYSFMRDPYLDFGPFGLVAFLFVLGVAYAVLYQSVRRGGQYAIILYSLLTYPLVIAFYAYQFQLTSWVYYITILGMFGVAHMVGYLHTAFGGRDAASHSGSG